MNKEDKNKDKYSEDVENNSKKKKDDENVMIELPDWDLEPPVVENDNKDDRGDL